MVVVVVVVLGGISSSSSSSSSDQFPESHTIIWKGQRKANEFYKGEQEFLPTCPGI